MKHLALTFDDGPGLTTMPRILDLLKQEGARATFFLWGEKINSQTAPVLHRALKEGHELANHSMHHLHMSWLSREEVICEVEDLQRLLRPFGVTPSLFRPPYLDHNEGMLSCIPMAFIAGASNRDWTEETDAPERLRLAKAAAEDGAILLMHCFEGNDATVEMLEVFLPWLREQGYGITTVSDLFARKGITPQPGRVYDRAE